MPSLAIKLSPQQIAKRQKLTFAAQKLVSAFVLKADMRTRRYPLKANRLRSIFRC